MPNKKVKIFSTLVLSLVVFFSFVKFAQAVPNFSSGLTVSSGSVGIGTTDPLQKLDVLGNAKVSGVLMDSYNTVRNMSSYEWNWYGRRYSGNRGGVLSLFTTFIDVNEAPLSIIYIHTNSLNDANYVGENVWGDVHDYHAIFTTYIHVNQQFSVTNVPSTGDDANSIYIDNKFVVGNAGCCVLTPYSYTFTRGWHKIDIMNGEGSGGHFVSLGWNPKNYTAFIDAMTPFGPTDFYNTETLAFKEGNVGIGTTNPLDKLSIGAQPTTGSTLGTGHNSTMGYITADLYALANIGYVQSVLAPFVPGGASTLWSGTSAGNIWNINSGNVGIGTTNPGSYKLNVNGGDIYGSNNIIAAGVLYGSRANFFSASNRSASDNQNTYGGPGDWTVNDIYTGQSNGWPTTYGNLITTRGRDRHTAYQMIQVGGGNPQLLMRNSFWDNTAWSNWSTILDSVNNVASAGNLQITGAGPHYISTGNVGIGTANPATNGGPTTAMVHLNSATTQWSVFHTTNVDTGAGAGDGTIFGVIGLDTVISNYESGNLVFATNGGAEKMRITSTGNVGINTTNPLDLLSIGAQPTTGSTLGTGHNSTMGYITADLYALANIGYVQSVLAPFVPGGASTLWSGTSAGNIWNINSGNVGIGTAGPLSKLDVRDGNVSLTNTSFTHGMSSYFNQNNYGVLGPLSTTNGGLTLVGISGTDAIGAQVWGVIGTATPSATTPAINLKANKQSGTGIGSLASTDTVLRVSNDSSSLLAVLGNGNVGIGTIAPGEKLEINGNLKFTAANPNIIASSYFNAPGGAYFSSGTVYTEAAIQARGGIHDDTHSYLTVAGGTSGYTYFSGNVGIGTASPGQKLTIAGAFTNVPIGGADNLGSDRPGLRISGDYPEIVVMSGIANPNHGPSISLAAYDSGSSGTYKSWTMGTAGNNATFLDIGYGITSNPHTNGIRGYGTTVMTLLNSGNVGIGTLGPNDSFSIGGAAGIAAPAGSDKTGHNYASTYVDNYALTNKGYVDAAVSGTNFWSGTRNNNIWNGDAGAGKVGIGTNNPGAKLDIVQAGNSSGGNLMLSGSKLNNTDKFAYISTAQYASDAEPEGVSLIGSLNSAADNIIFIGGGIYEQNAATQILFYVSPSTVKPANTSGVLAMTINSSNVGVNGTMTVAGVSTFTGSAIFNGGATVNGNITMGGSRDITNVHKLQADIVDPLYNIKGTNYSTYAAAIAGGLREEYVGRILAADFSKKNGYYETTIDFSKEKVGSDLWVWYSVVEFNDSNVEIFLTPRNGFTSAYASITGSKIIVRADHPVDMSMRLVGRRFDWRDWPTKALDQTEKASLIIK